ncbi:MAG: ornithine carbamoyltransferase, partial [Nitrososphaerota archaeon]
MVRHFLSLDEYTPREVRAVLDRARKLKKRGYPNTLPLRRKIIALIFQKPSTRTRVSIQSAVAKLGGESI